MFLIHQESKTMEPATKAHTRKKVLSKEKKVKTKASKNLNINEVLNQVHSEIQWLKSILDKRIKEIEAPQEPIQHFKDFDLPEINQNSPYDLLVQRLKLPAEERLLLITCLVTAINPQILSSKLRNHDKVMRPRFLEFGGFIDHITSQFNPTIQTVLFLLAGNELNLQTSYRLQLYSGKLFKEGVISLSSLNLPHLPDTYIHRLPALEAEYEHFLLSGVEPRPDFGKAFPATWVTTELDWDDLVLTDKTKESVSKLMRWLKHGENLKALSPKFNPSYPVLFYGPPGTGKSLTTKLIGKTYGKEVFRVDLSMIVSKYIGETEKNLAYLFDRAEGKNWILFFDEADSLFSKRTEVNNANDKWANLEVSYLLQRMEEYGGLTILATNLANQIDPAMTRRFQQIIYFGKPKNEQREKIWRTALPAPFSFDKQISIEKLRKYDLSGANIANVIKDACLGAMDADNGHVITPEILSESITKEFVKENRTP